MAKRENYNLRTLQQEDLEKVLEWRNSERIRINMYSDHIIDWEEHLAWFSRIKDKQDSSYCICELDQRPIGMIYFTDIDLKNSKSVWGFYLGETDTPPGSGVGMEFLALEYAFEKLEIRKLSCEVFEFNKSVIKLHKRFGFEQEGYFAKQILKNNKYLDVVFLSLFQENWFNNKAKLSKLAFR